MKIPFFNREKRRRLPLVSVITPALNASATIEATIESVVNQSYRNIEFILVDGQSTDGTVDIIKKAARKHQMIRWISEPDNGAYDAMNKGLAMSLGDWVYFLGADDILFNKNVLLDLFEEGLFSQEKVFYGNVIIEGNSSWAKDQEVYAGEFNLGKFLMQNICHQAIFYPRLIVKKVGFFRTEYVVCADWDYNIRCWADQPFLFVDKIIARFRGSGLSSIKQDILYGEESAGNVVQYFGLDPDNPSLVATDSPYRHVVLTFQKRNIRP